MQCMRFLLLVLPFLMIACGNRLKPVTEMNDLGYKIEYGINPKTKLKEGVYKVYDSNGKLYEQTDYKADKIDGKRTLFYPNGQAEIIEIYVQGNYQGPYQAFYENGNLKSTGSFENNKAEGEWKSYYNSGKIKEIVVYRDNIENGPFKEFYENGNKKAEGQYKNGDNEDGLLLLYDDQGQLEKKMDCNLGTCTTIWKKTEHKS